MANKGKYISVGILRYRSELDDKKQPAREYQPGQVIDEDLDKADVDRWLEAGAIREAKLAQKEQQAREEAKLAADEAADAQARAEAAAQAALTGNVPADATPEPAVTRPAGNKRK